MYEKSPKKCRELDSVIEELGNCLDVAEFSARGGSRPLRASGTRFVAHKVAALGRFIDKYGAYLNHLTTLVGDSSQRLHSLDRQKLKGYVKKWRDSKILLGCAVFHDILKPFAQLCKILQEDNACIVRAIEAIMKTAKAMSQLKSSSFEDLPCVKKVMSRIVKDDTDSTVKYQQVELLRYDEGVVFLNSHYKDYCSSTTDCLRGRIKIQGIELFTSALTILATNGWERNELPNFAHDALNKVCTQFQVPLENRMVDTALVLNEWDDMVDYAKRYLNLIEDYKVTWWKLYNCPDSSNWSNVLAVVELLFCLPVSNGPLERVFSQLKLIKTNRCTKLGQDRLDSLMRIKVEGPALSEWDATRSVELWWQSKLRRKTTDKTGDTSAN